MNKVYLLVAISLLFCHDHPATAQDTSISSSPPYEILGVRVISWEPSLYHGWPTLARRSNGELLLAFSGGREQHVCPFGRLEWMRSSDAGITWGWPQVLYDSPIDDRDAGLVETARGSILVSTFTSLAYESFLQRAESAKLGEVGAFGEPKRLDRWRAAHRRLSDDARKNEVGTYMMRSTDGGVTWSSRYAIPIDSPHGPIVLRDGRLLYPGKAIHGDGTIGICESTDDGLTWSWLSKIPTRSGDQVAKYHELHGVETTDGTVICHIRNENEHDALETLQSESKDAGRSWSMPHSIGVWGLPSHLLRLKNGSLLMTYGHRRKPLGILASLSRDHGGSWSAPIILTADGTSWDLGYPSTVECDDGTLVTAWYEVLTDSPLAQIRQARWRLAR